MSADALGAGQRCLVTGGAGFIGSTLVDRLLERGCRVTALDNISTGFQRFLDGARTQPGFSFIEGDLLDRELLARAMQGCDVVFHLAANADVRFGTSHPAKDLEQNTIGTFKVLEAMREQGVRRIVFSSTGSIYGEPSVFPTPEEAPFPVQTSLYGASKLAGEGLIGAYCAGFGMQGWIFRFVSVLGERYTHGHVFDFYKGLLADPTTLHVLGNGKQRKSYMYVQDCIDGMLLALQKAQAQVNIFNLGLNDSIEVNQSIAWIAGRLGLSPQLRYGGGERGWIGDSPLIHLDVARISALGWTPQVSLRDAVLRTLDWLQANRWVLQGARMKVCVYGLSHLGIVTAACLGGAGFCTTGIDDDAQTVAALRRGEPPLFEPGLAELLREVKAGGSLSFSHAYDAVAEADLVWITFDTPVDEEDDGDPAFVMDRVAGLFPSLRDGAVVLVSSQLPVGSVAALERRFAAVGAGRRVSFACSPENLRLGRAIADFTAPARTVVGVRDDGARALLDQVLGRFSANLVWMSVESAEMAKHAVNAFLATSIAFTNELASICERVGADAADVERALRSEPRIGAKAYVRAGAAFFGGTLGRDLAYLNQLAAAQQVPVPLLGSVVASNSGHRLWPVRQLERRLGNAVASTVAVFGLAYKPGTDSTRRSPGVAVCRWLIAHGAAVRVVDPRVRALPDDLRGAVEVYDSAETALAGADALVVATEWPEFAALSADTVSRAMRRPLVIDQSHHLAAVFAAEPRVTYVTPGRPS